MQRPGGSQNPVHSQHVQLQVLWGDSGWIAQPVLVKPVTRRYFRPVPDVFKTGCFGLSLDKVPGCLLANRRVKSMQGAKSWQKSAGGPQHHRHPRPTSARRHGTQKMMALRGTMAPRANPSFNIRFPAPAYARPTPPLNGTAFLHDWMPHACHLALTG